MALRLITMLERSNYVRASDLCPGHPERGEELMRRAGMVLYSTLRGLWVPDVGTYDWIVSIKQLAKEATNG
jgi:hypothetical protein